VAKNPGPVSGPAKLFPGRNRPRRRETGSTLDRDGFESGGWGSPLRSLVATARSESASVWQVKLPVRIRIRLTSICKGVIQVSRRRILRSLVFADLTSLRMLCRACCIRCENKGRSGNHCCQDVGADGVSRRFHDHLLCCLIPGALSGIGSDMGCRLRHSLLILAVLAGRLPKPTPTGRLAQSGSEPLRHIAALAQSPRVRRR
jgi:hypothetical protein